MSDEELKNDDKLLSALAYPIPIIALFLIFTDKKNIRFCRYHGWQALFLGLAGFGLSLVISILGSIPGIGCAVAIIAPFIGLAWLIVAIIYCVKTMNGDYVVIPVISDFAKNYIDAA